MNATNRTPLPENPLTALESWLRSIIREEIQTAIGQNGHQNKIPLEITSQYLSVEQAAKFSSLGKATIRLNIDTRQLKAYKVGSRIVVKTSDLERFLESHPLEILSD